MIRLLSGPLPRWLERRVVVLAPGERRAPPPGGWRNALAVLEIGSVVLEDGAGAQLRLEEGAVFWLAGRRPATVHNDRTAPAVIVLVMRRAPSALRRRGGVEDA